MLRDAREAERLERAAAGLWVTPRPGDPPEWSARHRWPLAQHLYPVLWVAIVREEARSRERETRTA
jgi:hypothetical protein